MVDVLGRCREVEEAKALAMSMHMEANSMVWLVLLSACKMHSNLDVAERAAKRINGPDCSAALIEYDKSSILYLYKIHHVYCICMLSVEYSNCIGLQLYTASSH
jgi:hypothetical protein